MNMRSLTVILGALSAFALGACTVTSTPGGTGGSTSTTGGVGGSGGAGGATASSSTGTGGGPACVAAYTCSEAIDGDPSKLCEGPSAMLYDAYYACTCETGGACFTACSDNACKDGAKSMDCTACLQVNDMGCAKELAACAGDAP